MQRTGKLRTDQLYHICIIGKIIQALANILSMKLTTYRMTDIIKHIRYKATFVTGKRNRFRHIGLIDIIGRPPRTVYPMCSRLQDIMLEVILMEKQKTFLRPFFGKLLQPVPIPCIGTVQIILAQSFPSSTFSTAGKRLFVEWPPHISITATDTLMIVTTTLIPQTVIMI